LASQVAWPMPPSSAPPRRTSPVGVVVNSPVKAIRVSVPSALIVTTNSTFLPSTLPTSGYSP